MEWAVEVHQTVFWSSVVAIGYAVAGFPLLLMVRALTWPRPYTRDPSYLPSVSVIIPAYNEERVIASKLRNTALLDYPEERWEVIVASDGSTDGTNAIVEQFRHPPLRLRLLALPRGGKNAALNKAMEVATGDIVVFSDADTVLPPDALRLAVAPFADTTVGGVAGDFVYTGTQGESAGECAHWSFDRFLRRCASRSGNVTSATGQIYAIRRLLVRPLPAGVIDDFFLSTAVIRQGFRLVFEPRLVALHPAVQSVSREFRRKVRNITIGFRGVWAARELLNPFRYGFYALQLFSHKVLRRLVVVPYAGVAVSATALWSQGFVYQAAAFTTFVLHLLALVGALGRNTRIGRVPLFALPCFFYAVNIACLVALRNALVGCGGDAWCPARQEEPMQQPACS